MGDEDDKAKRDRELVEGVLARRNGAFEALVERHQRLVWHLVFRLVQHPEDTRELSQEVFLRVYRQLAQFRIESTLATWIGRIAYNVCIRHLQRKRLPIVELDANGSNEDLAFTAENVADDFDLAAACANEDLLAHLRAAIDALPAVPRAVLTLYYLEELGVSEVAEIMDKPEGTIKNTLFRARARLRETLEHLLGEDKA